MVRLLFHLPIPRLGKRLCSPLKNSSFSGIWFIQTFLYPLPFDGSKANNEVEFIRCFLVVLIRALIFGDRLHFNYNGIPQDSTKILCFFFQFSFSTSSVFIFLKTVHYLPFSLHILYLHTFALAVPCALIVLFLLFILYFCPLKLSSNDTCSMPKILLLYFIPTFTLVVITLYDECLYYVLLLLD